MLNSHPARSHQVIYVVDDQKMIARTVCLILQHNGYQARWFSEARDLLDASAICPPALVVSDVMMPGMNGIELADAFRLARPACKILFFSGQANTGSEEFSTATGRVLEMLVKPIRPDVLLGRVAHLLSAHIAHPEPPYLAVGGRRHSDTSNRRSLITTGTSSKRTK